MGNADTLALHKHAVFISLDTLVCAAMHTHKCGEVKSLAENLFHFKLAHLCEHP